VRKSSIVKGRQHLIDAALRTLAERGYRRASLRKIAENAGVTAGLVRHYFRGKDALFLEAYRHFKATGLEAYLRAAREAGPDPVKRLEGFVRSVLTYRTGEGEQMKIWAGFVELVVTDPNLAAAQAVAYDRFVEEISGCIFAIHAVRGEALSVEAAREMALGVNAVIDGVWLECSLNPSRMTTEEALYIALDMIGTRLGVSFSSERD